MGIQDRDYYRDGSRSLFESWGRQGATVWLIVITTGVFLAQCVTGRPVLSPLVVHGSFWPEKVLDGEVWRLVTALFLHFDLWHLFLNMLVLYFIGSRLEEVYGPREFLALYLAAGIGSHLLALGIEVLDFLPVGRGIGASGAISALVVVFAFQFPRQQILLFFVIPMPMWVAAALFVFLDALGAVGVGPRGTGYVVHLGGALFGLVYYQTGLRLTGLFKRPTLSSRSRLRPQLRVVPAEPSVTATDETPRPRDSTEGDAQLETRLDQVLAKVSQFGQRSLTPEEREILAKASELYKKRRK